MKTCILRIVACLALLTSLGLASTALANPIGGPVSGVSRVSAFSVNLHRIAYKGGEQADFAIVGDGDTTLNIIVRDEFGNVVVRTHGAGDRARVTWTPTRNAVYYISVVNEGDVYNEYAWRGF